MNPAGTRTYKVFRCVVCDGMELQRASEVCPCGNSPRAKTGEPHHSFTITEPVWCTRCVDRGCDHCRG